MKKQKYQRLSTKTSPNVVILTTVLKIVKIKNQTAMKEFIHLTYNIFFQTLFKLISQLILAWLEPISQMTVAILTLLKILMLDSSTLQ